MSRIPLTEFKRQLHLEPKVEDEILREIETHVQDRAQELKERGMTEEEAMALAMKRLGQPRRLARSIYAVHSRASWRDTLVAVLPHLLFSLLFAFHLWTKAAFVIALLILTALVSLRGWKNGRPSWTYPWLGYCILAPVASWVLALVALAYGAWSFLTHGTLPLGIPIYLASLIYLPISLWIILSIFYNLIRRDWLLASLASFPFPFLAFLLLYLNGRGNVLEPRGTSLGEADATTALVFLILAISTAIFFRMGSRIMRAILIVITPPGMILLAWISYKEGPGYPAVFLISVASVLLLLAPAWLEQRLDPGRGKEVRWLDQDMAWAGHSGRTS